MSVPIIGKCSEAGLQQVGDFLLQDQLNDILSLLPLSELVQPGTQAFAKSKPPIVFESLLTDCEEIYVSLLIILNSEKANFFLIVQEQIRQGRHSSVQRPFSLGFQGPPLKQGSKQQAVRLGGYRLCVNSLSLSLLYESSPLLEVQHGQIALVKFQHVEVKPSQVFLLMPCGL